jgi:putative hydrolase of the HAD superfamily
LENVLSRTQKTLIEAILGCEFAMIDNDGVTYFYTEEFYESCKHAAARAGCELVPGLSFDEAYKLGCESYGESGSSSNVFVDRYGVSPKDAHEFFHRYCDDSIIPIDERLSSGFDGFQMPRALLTHSNRDWTYRVLNRLNLRRHFSDDQIYTFEDVGYRMKSDSAAPFLQVLHKEGYQPKESLIIEDSAANLVWPKKIGMTTVLVTGGRGIDPAQHPYVDFMVRDLHEFLSAASGLHPSRSIKKRAPLLVTGGPMVE